MNFHQAQTVLTIATPGRALVEITSQIRSWLGRQSIEEGLLTVFIRHTSASLLIQENADPDVRADLQRFFARLVRDGDPLFEHVAEGPDDMPSHIRSALTQTQLNIPIHARALTLGTWQGVYVWEHRVQSHSREVVLHAIGTIGD